MGYFLKVGFRIALAVFCLGWGGNVIFNARADEPSQTFSQKKVAVSESVIDSSIEDVQWCGSDRKTVLVKSHSGRLYRSKTSGKKWDEITELLAVGLGPSAGMTVESMIVSPVDPNIFLVVGSKRNHFISEDSAMTFRRIQHSSPVHSWVFHPVEPHWALLSSWTEACLTNSPGCNHLLYLTKDLGQSFTLVSSFVVQFSWGDKSRGQEDRIYYTHHTTTGGAQPRSGGWSKDVDFSVTSDFGKTSKVLVERGNKFLVSNGFVFVAKLADSIEQTVNMFVSYDGKDGFEQALLPEGSVQEKSYTILDTSEGAIMMHVNHGIEGRSTTGNVYISDSKGLRYSLSLPNNVRTAFGECEFDKVLSLEGVFIANFRDDINPDSDTDPAASERNYAMEETMETATDLKRRQRGKNEDIIRTVISFDKGGKWSFLVPPKVDSLGKPIECAPEGGKCWLHLHGITNFHQYAPFYSVPNAPGIVMGTGAVGSHLRFEPDEVNTFLSRDGGLTWVEAHKGAYIYEFGDHGGLIVMADDIHKTKQVVFSWNEGQSWFDFELGQYPIDVDNIVIEPNSASVVFLLYGTRGSVGVIYHLDFAALGQPPCVNVYGANSVSSDYETWVPSDGRSSGAKCLLGKESTYTRRKQTSECFNGKDFSRPVVKKNCACTKEDYECEYGFARRVGSLECKLKDTDLLTTEGCTSASFFFTLPYRKVPGNSCEAGWTPEKVAVPCSAKSPFSKGARTVLLCILLVAFLMFAFTYSSRSRRLKHLFKNYGFESFSNVHYNVLGRPTRKDSDDIALESAVAGSYNYEPELGFIESEQDEHEDDAPTLMSYKPNDFGKTNAFPFESLPQRDKKIIDNSDDDIEQPGTPHRRTPTDVRTVSFPTDPVPRLAPPPGSERIVDDEGLELL